MQKGGAAWWQGCWEDPGCHGDCSWSQNANLENVDRGPLQPLSRRRPFIRRQSIRNEPNIGARQPRFSSATRWLLAVQLKVTSMASDMGSLASHNHVLGSTYHREALSPIPAPSILMCAPGQPDLTPSSLVPFIHHLGSLSAPFLLNQASQESCSMDVTLRKSLKHCGLEGTHLQNG